MSCDSNAYDLAKSLTTGSNTRNTSRIKTLTQELLNTTDCDAIRAKIAITQDEIDQLSSGVAAQAATLAANFQPLMKLPKNFKKIIGYAKKQVTAMVMPQIQAYIKATELAIEILNDSQEFISAVRSVGPYLEECAISTALEEIRGIENQLNTTINKAVLNITGSVDAGLCDLESNLLGADVINNAALSAQRDLAGYQSTAETANQAINNTLQLIGAVSDLTYEVSGVRLDVDTSTVTDFQTSIASGALTTFVEDLQEFIDKDPPINTESPVISGNTSAVGQVLSVTNGTWSGNNVTFGYQWYRNGQEIYGATSNTYTTVAADSTSDITVEVIADNDGGGDIAEANNVTTTFTAGGVFSFNQRL